MSSIAYEYQILYYRKFLWIFPVPAFEPVQTFCFLSRPITKQNIQTWRAESKAHAMSDIKRLLGDKAKGIYCEVTPPMRCL